MPIIVAGLFIALIFWPATSAGQTSGSDRLKYLLSAAREAQQKNDFSSAAVFYKEAVDIRPGTAELWADLGVMQYQSGDPTAATQSLLKAADLNSSLFVPNLFLGLSFLRLDHAKRAITYLTTARAENGSDPQVYLALGRAYSSVGDQGSAIEAFTEAVKLDPRSGDAWFGFGMASLETVEQESRTLSEDDPSSPYSQMLFAESLQRQQRSHEAENVYKTALLTSPMVPCLHARLGLLYLEQGKLNDAQEQFSADSNSGSGCGLAELGFVGVAIETGSNEQALSRLRALWERDSDFIVAHYGDLSDSISRDALTAFETYVNDQRREGNATGGLSGFIATRQALPHAPSPPSSVELQESPSAALLRAKNEYLTGHYSSCVLDLSRLKLPNGHDKTALESLCAFLAGNYEHLFNLSKAWLVKEPNNPEALYWSIEANQKRALNALVQFERIDPHSTKTHILMGDLYRRRQQFEEAQAEYAEALKTSPNDFAALFGLAWTYRLNSKLEDAKSICIAALSERPDDPELNLLMGEILMSLHDYEGTESFLRKGFNAKLQMRPHAHALMGKLYAEKGRTAEAISELLMGLNSDVDGSVHYQLAIQYRKSGNVSAYGKMIEQFKAIDALRQERAVTGLQDLPSPAHEEDGP